MYHVYIKSSITPIKSFNDLRAAALFAKAGRSRRIFNDDGTECTQGGVTGITLKEFLHKK